MKAATSEPTKGRILAVNDDEAIREIVCSMLTSAGYQCRTASDGLEALAVLDSSEEFDLLLTNLIMPDLDGIELLERTKEKFPDMPVVLETAVHDLSLVFTFIRIGGYDYLRTPFEREQLLNVVSRALEYRRLKLENRALQAQVTKLRQEVASPMTLKPLLEGFEFLWACWPTH
jgi:two-component system C4-dicarboxylate transport response regulator DctD